MQHDGLTDDFFTSTDHHHHAVCGDCRCQPIGLHVDVGVTIKAIKLSSPVQGSMIAAINELKYVIGGNRVYFIVIRRDSN